LRGRVEKRWDEKGRRGDREEGRRGGKKWGGEERGEVNRGDGPRRGEETGGSKKEVSMVVLIDERTVMNRAQYLYWKESSAARVFLRTRTPSLLPAWTPLNCTAYVTVLPFGTKREGAPENPTPRGAIEENGEI
jgi:hypothetical protein